jgi:hypothetical protein
LLFADACADFGILTLLRTTELGPFTSSEIRMLTFALNTLSDRLSALGLQPAPQHIAAATWGKPNVHVTSRHLGLKSKSYIGSPMGSEADPASRIDHHQRSRRP